MADTGRTIDWTALVRRAWGKERSQKDDAYVFSNGRRFKSTDDTESGIYVTPTRQQTPPEEE